VLGFVDVDVAALRAKGEGGFTEGQLVVMEAEGALALPARLGLQVALISF